VHITKTERVNMMPDKPKQDIFSAWRDKIGYRGVFGLRSKPSVVSHRDAEETLSTAEQGSKNYNSLRAQMANAADQPGAAECVIENDSGEATIVVAGSSPKANSKTAQLEATKIAAPIRQSCGPAKDFKP
jgi:hypothetical protein